MNTSLNKYLPPLLTLLVGVGVWLFWWLAHPEVLCYEEQNQLFLWTADYLCADLRLSGGLASWLGELITQFYYLPWLGALLLGILFAAMQGFAWGVVRTFTQKSRPLCLLLSLISGAVLLLAMGDIEVLTALPVAVTLALGTAWLTNRLRAKWWTDFLTVAVLFWLIGGGATWLYLAVRLCFLLSRSKRRWPALVLLPWLLAVEVGSYRVALSQYPLEDVLLGQGYYRIPMHHPLTSLGYDAEVCNLLRYNMLLRNEDWDGILTLAGEKQAETAFTSNCVNLALGVTRQLADRMFSYYQSGEDALLAPRTRDNMSMYPTMEAFWQLGLVNESLRYAFDLQESILSAKKSGRLTMRIAECNIANGNYRVARKHLDLLKQSLFYRSWAIEKEKLLGDETAISHDIAIGKARRMRFKNDFLFSYDEKDKILGLLFINNPTNKLALDYFMGDMMLKGNIQGFLQHMSWVQQYGGYMAMPVGYRDAVECIQSKGGKPGSPYGNYVKRMMEGNNSQKGGEK